LLSPLDSNGQTPVPQGSAQVSTSPVLSPSPSPLPSPSPSVAQPLSPSPGATQTSIPSGPAAKGNTTVANGPAPTTHSTGTGGTVAIAVGVTAGVLLLIFGLVALWWWRRRRSYKSSKSGGFILSDTGTSSRKLLATELPYGSGWGSEFTDGPPEPIWPPSS